MKVNCVFVFQQQAPPVQTMEDDEESVGEEIEEEVTEEIEEEERTLQEEEEASTPTPTTPPTPAQLAAEVKASETEESEPPQIESDSEGVTVVAPPPKRKGRMLKPVSIHGSMFEQVEMNVLLVWSGSVVSFCFPFFFPFFF